MPCSWESNHRYGIALALSQTLMFLHLRAQGLEEGDALCSLVQHGWLHHLPLCNSILKFLLFVSILNFCPCSSIQRSQSFSRYVSADVWKNVRDKYRHHSYPCVFQWSKHPKITAKLNQDLTVTANEVAITTSTVQLFTLPCEVVLCCANAQTSSLSSV